MLRNSAWHVPLQFIDFSLTEEAFHYSDHENRSQDCRGANVVITAIEVGATSQTVSVPQPVSRTVQLSVAGKRACLQPGAVQSR